MEPIKGTDQWGNVFDENSIEVKEYQARFPDVTLEEAIASVVDIANHGKGSDEI